MQRIIAYRLSGKYDAFTGEKVIAVIQCKRCGSTTSWEVSLIEWQDKFWLHFKCKECNHYHLRSEKDVHELFTEGKARIMV